MRPILSTCIISYLWTDGSTKNDSPTAPAVTEPSIVHTAVAVVVAITRVTAIAIEGSAEAPCLKRVLLHYHLLRLLRPDGLESIFILHRELSFLELVLSDRSGKLIPPFVALVITPREFVG